MDEASSVDKETSIENLVPPELTELTLEFPVLATMLTAANLNENAVFREMKMSALLVKEGCYTEAALRLGRALEAGIYELANLMEIDLTARVIPELDSIQQQIQEAQVKILSTQSAQEVRKLTNIIKNLADAIAALIEDPSQRVGKLTEDRARPNEQLYRELIQRINDPAQKAKLGKEIAQIRVMQSIRNHAAHAALDGTEREINKEEYIELTEKLSTVMATLFEVFIAEQARRTEELLGKKQP